MVDNTKQEDAVDAVFIAYTKDLMSGLEKTHFPKSDQSKIFNGYTNAIKSLINQQVLQALEKVKSKANLIEEDKGFNGTVPLSRAVKVSVIEEIERDYRNE